MKNLTLIRTKIILCLCFIASVTGFINAQTPTQNLSPAITFKTENGELKLTCKEGCAWKELSFTIPSGQKQLVTEYGMSSGAEADARPHNPSLSKFTFSVIKNKRGKVTVKNIEGMSFKKIKFFDKDQLSGMEIIKK